MMLAESGQIWAVVLIVIAAAMYLMVAIRKALRRGGDGSGCGCCGSSSLCEPRTRPEESQPARDADRHFVSREALENKAAVHAADLRNPTNQ
jgi:hypothetical protein